MEHESMAATAVDPGNAPRSPDLADFGAINDMYVRCMAALDDEEIRRRTAPFTVPEIRSRAGNARARALLDEFGIVVVPGVVDEPECRRAQEAVDALYDRYRALGVPAHEDERVVYQVGPGRLKGYRQFAGSGKTVIRVRGGQDEGVVDIFNCDMALSGELDGVRSSFEAGDVLGVLASKDVKPRNLNVYINRGIARTRGFHVDSYEPQVKAFIYLTDVNTLGDGPYTYVAGTHRDSPIRRVNQKLCAGIEPATEAPVVDPLMIAPILARKGALIISDQSGSHRGWPQSPAAHRVLGVMNYK